MKIIFKKVSSKSILKILSYLSIFKILSQTIFILYLQDTFEKYLAQHCIVDNKTDRQTPV